MRKLLWAGLCGCFLASGCATGSGVPDLAKNSDLYQQVGFVTKLPGDRSVFVAPVADERRADALPASVSGFPIMYDSDARWSRAVPIMIDDLLRREIETSGLFAAMATQAKDADLVLQPSLQTFAMAQMEMPTGGRALAEAHLRIRVWGPAVDGQRPLLHDEIYGDSQATKVQMRTISRHLLAGRATQIAMMRVLQGLDGANVGRSGMPAVPLPTPPTK